MTAIRTVTLIPGDGVGPEIADAVVRIFAAASVPIAWERVIAGEEALRRQGSAIPAELIGSVLRTRVALKGHLAARLGESHENPNVALRKTLDLYANVRPVQSFPGRACRYPDLDLVVVRENTEGEYAGLEHRVVPGVVESIRITTERACTRIARFAFAHAAAAGRKKITAVHKANIMKKADGLFLECCRAVAKDHPGIQLQEMIVAKVDEAYVNGSAGRRLPHNLNISFAYVEGESVLLGLNKDVALSSGSACTSATLEPSYVISALGVDAELAHSSIRFGLHRFSTEEEVEFVGKRTVEVVLRLREMSPLYELAKEGVDLRSINWKAE